MPSALKNFEERQNIYVRVYGSVRVFKEERAIVGSKIEEIKEHNEVTNHLLQVFVSHQARLKGSLSNEQLKNKEGGMVKVKQQSSEESVQTVLDLITEMNKSQQQNFSHKIDLWTVV